MKNKGQVWGVDMMVSVVIFTIGIIIFYIYSINYSSSSKEGYEKVLYQARVISEDLLSEGFPEDWNQTNVLRLGLLTENKLDSEKISYLYNLTKEDYNRTKRLLDTSCDYFIVIGENLTIDGEEVIGIGKPLTNLSSVESENLVKVSRAGIYENKPVSIYIYVWE